jgi:hypothetical protein
MSDISSERPPNAVLYSDKLTGLGGECPVCSEREMSTGWLVYHDDVGRYWYLDLKCTGCGSRGATWRREWLPLITEVLEAEAKEARRIEGGDER